MPTKRQENKLKKQGYQYIAGVDEAGKGAWAGPIVAAAVVLPTELRIAGVNDSKLLSPVQREKLFVKITKQALAWQTGIVSEKVIDREGIVRANAMAIDLALRKLNLSPHYILIDGRHFVNQGRRLEFQGITSPVQFIIDGDAKVYSIAAASIVAKVVRDHILSFEHKNFPDYGFAKHKGYGTKEHHCNVLKYGVCELHRRSFAPISEL